MALQRANDIAMEIGQELHDHFNGDVYFICHNVERDEESFESLTREVGASRLVYPDVPVTSYPVTFEDNVDGILDAIPANAAALYFLDPWGYQNINMVVMLLERRYSEVIVTFMSSFWNRFLGDETKESLHDENFDTPGWRELLDFLAASASRRSSSSTGATSILESLRNNI